MKNMGAIFDFFLIPWISERFNVELRAEMFNVFNHANYLPPIDNETILGQSGAIAAPGVSGKLDSSSGFESRQIQLNLKVI